MAEGESAKPITDPPDPIKALAVYWLRADVMLRLVQASEGAWLEDAAKHKTEFETYIAFWLSALYFVIEGFRKLRLGRTKVPALANSPVWTGWSYFATAAFTTSLTTTR